MKLKFVAYRATDELEMSREYMQGHVKVLIDYGIVNITSNNTSWIDKPHNYCVTARDESGELVGGIRIQVADGITPLPVEMAIGNVDNKIYDFVRELAINRGVGELCGLWNSRKVKGIGVSILLVRSAISLLNQFKIEILTGICAEYSLPMFKKVGFVINTSLGNKGEFIYPNDNYIARVVGILDAYKLDTADPIERKKILDLRKTPQQSKIEEGLKGNLEVDYDLIIPNITPIKLPEYYVRGKR